jgi:hypothetical protein
MCAEGATLCSEPRHGQSRRKLLVWLVGVACGRDGSTRGQHHHLGDAVLSRQFYTSQHVGDGKKHIPMGACNLRVVTGLLGWASCLARTADPRKSQTTKARSRRPLGFRQARYWHSRIGETLTRYLSEGSGAVDKLGMMRCVVSGRSFQFLALSLSLVRSKRPDRTLTSVGHCNGATGCGGPAEPPIWLDICIHTGRI